MKNNHLAISDYDKAKLQGKEPTFKEWWDVWEGAIWLLCLTAIIIIFLSPLVFTG